ncbi:hypothetical protein QBC38DRAFT_516499 [Podospora fimiseda]|uniref:Aminoglycoside phosphotransferase domain-containing protein n=1 Tax=Podospora fimiseda TaxID=252190 RepID=A0AAN7GP42_9PEZI|nr:hypothetical protein QBC38DRAFT_516499 [Podospora fimiseda]
MPTHNHVNYEARLAFVRKLLTERFNLEDNFSITPIQYDPDFIFKYNNFVYHISLPSPLTSDLNAFSQPGTVPIPKGTKDLIIRLGNPSAEGIHHQNRIENEVAIINLVSSALSDAGIQPCITKLLRQMAKIIKALQEYKLPSTITKYGGLTFNESGGIASTAMPTVGAGPWETYEESFRYRLELELEESDANPYVKGWHGNGLGKRIEEFVKLGFSEQFELLGGKDDKVVVHCDFNYDFSWISHPSYEFLRSFAGLGGQFRGWSVDEENQEAALRDAKLHGFPESLPVKNDENTDSGIDWEAAKAWEDALEEEGVKRPRTMQGIEKVADVDTVLCAILPWRFTNPDIVARQTEEVLMKCREENEKELDGLLKRLGF